MVDRKDERSVPDGSNRTKGKLEVSITGFLESTVNLDHDQARAIEQEWHKFIVVHAAIGQNTYNAGKILNNIHDTLEFQRGTWGKFLKKVRFPRTTANTYMKLAAEVEKTIPSVAVRNILSQYTDPGRPKVIAAAKVVGVPAQVTDKAAAQRLAAKIIEISTQPSTKTEDRFAPLASAYRSLTAFKKIFEKRTFQNAGERHEALERAFGSVVLAAAFDLQVQMPTGQPAEGAPEITGKVEEIPPYDLSTGTEA